MLSRLFSKTLNCDPASDHRDELALGIGVAVDVSLESFGLTDGQPTAARRAVTHQHDERAGPPE